MNNIKKNKGTKRKGMRRPLRKLRDRPKEQTWENKRLFGNEEGEKCKESVKVYRKGKTKTRDGKETAGKKIYVHRGNLITEMLGLR